MTHIILILCIVAFIAFTEFRLKEDIIHIHRELLELHSAVKTLKQHLESVDTRIDNLIIGSAKDGKSMLE